MRKVGMGANKTLGKDKENETLKAENAKLQAECKALRDENETLKAENSKLTEAPKK